MEDATYYLESSDTQKAKTAITSSKHFIHDALIFSKNPDFDQQLELLDMINSLDNNRLELSELKHSLDKLRSFI